HFSFSQSGGQEDDLSQRVLSNQQLMRTDMEKAYANIEIFLEEAVKTGNKDAELTLLANKCRYFQITGNISELIIASEYLHSKASAYSDINMQAVAKKYLGEAYQRSELFDDAVKELNNALAILKNEELDNENTINSKANIYISL